jgi:hypothetical protein
MMNHSHHWNAKLLNHLPNEITHSHNLEALRNDTARSIQAAQPFGGRVKDNIALAQNMAQEIECLIVERANEENPTTRSHFIPIAD